MTNPEIKVGQKYRVVDAEQVGFSVLSDGDEVEIKRVERGYLWWEGYVNDHVFLDDKDIAEGHVELIEDVQESTEPSKDDSPAWATSILEGVETHAQEATEAPTDIQSGLSAELLWKFIEGSSEYNQHKQFEVGELPWDVLKDAVKTLGEYLEDYGDTLETSLEIRLMYNGNLSEKFKHTWGASVYQLDYWKEGEHKDGHKDRLLFGVEIVRGV